MPFLSVPDQSNPIDGAFSSSETPTNPVGEPGQLLLPAKVTTRKGVGGAGTHKDPACPCVGCRARRRKAQAFALAGRPGGLPDIAEKIEGNLIRKDGKLFAKKRNKGMRSQRARVGQWLAIRQDKPELKDKDIAAILGISPRTLTGYIQTAHREGWLSFPEALDQIEYSIIPKTLENLEGFLQNKDKQVTIEVAKGTIFKSYAQAKGVNEAPQTILALKIEMPSEDVKVAGVVGGTIVGTPKRLRDAEIIDG